METTAVLTVAFVLRLKPQGEEWCKFLFPKLKLGANYFISPLRCSSAQTGISRVHSSPHVLTIAHWTLNHCTLKMPVVGSLLFVSLRTNRDCVVGSLLFVSPRTNRDCVVGSLLFVSLRTNRDCVVGSLLFVSLRTKRDSPLHSLVRLQEKIFVEWQRINKESFSMCVKKRCPLKACGHDKRGLHAGILPEFQGFNIHLHSSDIFCLPSLSDYLNCCLISFKYTTFAPLLIIIPSYLLISWLPYL